MYRKAWVAARVTRPGSRRVVLSALVLGAAVTVTLAFGADTPRRGFESIEWLNDSLIRLARNALAEGRPWRATEILRPVTAVGSARPPEALIVAARAATGWRGWDEVVRLLESEPWLDSLFERQGRALLARAQLELDLDSIALQNARLALEPTLPDSLRRERIPLLARVLAALEDSSAASAFMAAAELEPALSDWYVLRAAEWTADSTARAALFARLALPHARDRIPLVEALARIHAGDSSGAAAAFTAAGNRAEGFRLRVAVARSPSDSASLRRDLLDAINRGSGASAARVYLGILDGSFAGFAPSEELGIARAVGSSGGSRGAAAYRRAFDAGLGNDSDRFEYATLLANLGRSEEAIALYERITVPSAPVALAAAAAYRRARTMVRSGVGGSARDALRGVLRDFPEDTSAGTALYLLADLATDEGRDEAARDAFLSMARRFPSSPRAPSALFNAAMIAYVDGDFAAAAGELTQLRSRYPSSADAAAALYWSGRAKEAGGDEAALAGACDRIRAGSDSVSYYGYLCSRRSGQRFWNPPRSGATFAPLPEADTISQRVRLLLARGFDTEVRLELERVAALGDDAEHALAAAEALRVLGYGSRAVALAQRAQSRGAPADERLYKLLYPSSQLELLAAEARSNGSDLALVAGLIRQESLFDPNAESPAGARGLMQLMPDVGRQIARSMDFAVWDPVLLWQPDVNARLGVRHLSELISTYSDTAHVLAAYNAGATRVDRWRTKRGVDDWEVFVERIPFVETRNYVRIVLRNREYYRALYEWN